MEHRRILHVDMDAFFAAVEQRDNPSLRGKPVIVGGSANSRGVVSTASYEARRYGIHSAMPMSEAKRRCPHGIFLPVNGSKYREASSHIFHIFRRYTPLVEGISLDEAFLDLTGCETLFGPAPEIAVQIKREIKAEVGLTASVGLSYCKFLAKLASDMDKPDGFTIIGFEDLTTRIHPMPISKMWGVGKKAVPVLERLGIRTIGDASRIDLNKIRRYIGSLADHVYLLAQGIDPRPVEPYHERKSVGQEVTFAEDVGDMEFLYTTLLAQSETVGRELRQRKLEAKTVTLKLRYPTFKTITRSHTLLEPTQVDDILYHTAKALLAKCGLNSSDRIRLIGISASGLVPERGHQQVTLFDETPERTHKLMEAVDLIRDKFGDQAVTRARLLKKGK
ncbi:DNA polymerase IV [Effusibacillus lacus]|uniref:DNA polymerase IV n=1 Tax=Effusibacillus lacus TaxID=1348429 RepID=A0A292YIE3_9BACL|nr:DNA polymerase IV [Effusibacillus lacus]TCS74489.1 DNA polymerase-4 [Effusibacillus lacus]GAX88641.1 DNA polymerase IV [Effusibacillus lacus]